MRTAGQIEVCCEETPTLLHASSCNNTAENVSQPSMATAPEQEMKCVERSESAGISVASCGLEIVASHAKHGLHTSRIQ